MRLGYGPLVAGGTSPQPWPASNPLTVKSMGTMTAAHITVSTTDFLGGNPEAVGQGGRGKMS